MLTQTEDLKKKLIVKAVRNVRKGYEKDEASRGMYRSGIKLDLQRSRLITQSYRETEGEPIILRRAKALEKILYNMDIYIQDWEKIVGNNVAEPNGLFFGIDMNWRSVKRVVTGEEGESLLDDAGRKELSELISYWKGKSMSDIQQQMFTGDILKYWKFEGTFMWTHWSELGIPNYEKIFRVGFAGIIDETEARLKEIDATVPDDYVDQKEFLMAVVISLKAVIRFAKRYAELAGKKAAESTDPEDKSRLEKIAYICNRVPEFPPETLIEALQSFFFIHIVRSIEYSTLGVGVRFDKIFGSYYEKDLRDGVITKDKALDLLQLLWIKFNEMGIIYSPLLTLIYGGVATLQAITLGGVDESGKDVTNAMTYLVLEAAAKLRTLEPSICLRYHEETPTDLLSKSADVIGTGLGYPSFFNDRSLIPLLRKWDVPEKDALDYAITGCVYLEIPGKNVAQRALGGLGLPKCLWWAFHQGMHPDTKIQWGAKTPDPRSFTTVEELIDAYLEQVRFFTERIVKIDNTCRHLYEKYLPRPYYSALLDGCIEKGKDCRAWQYPSRVHDFLVIMGATNTADSITAVKKIVFEEKKVTMDKLIEAMNHNWEGYEDIRQMMLRAPKYGNDDEYADEIAQMVHHKTADVMAEFKNRFGYPIRGDGSGMSGTYGGAILTPATPDGRKNGETYADATLSPTQGRDNNGPTAVLKSAARIDTSKTYNHLLNQKFLPEALQDDRKDIFINYLRSWGDLGISHIQFNVVDRDTLIDAQKNPDQHADLIVRVAGYSAYFTDLSKGLQDTIISRTEQNF